MNHQVPEMMFSTDDSPAHGISAVKVIAIASAEGQRIWTIDQNNWHLAQDALNLPADTLQDIRNAVHAGKVVTTHEEQILFHGWVGEGYIILDPETGGGAYMIAGGENGGFLQKQRDRLFRAKFNLSLLYAAGPNMARVVAISGYAAAAITILSTAISLYDAVIACWDDLNIVNALAILAVLAFLAAQLAIIVANPILAVGVSLLEAFAWSGIFQWVLGRLC